MGKIINGNDGSVPDGHVPDISAITLSDTNIDLSVAADPNPVSSVTLVDNNTILLNGQTDAKQNGPYTAVDATDPTTWIRHPDADSDADFLYGMKILVTEGDFGDKLWILTSDKVVVGTDNINFVSYDDGAFVENTNGSIQRRSEGAPAGNSRGTNAFDAQGTRANADEVASGANSAVIGERNKATAQASIAMGYSSEALKFGAFASGEDAVANGTNAVSIGRSLTNTGTRGVMVGYNASNTLTDVFSSGTGGNTVIQSSSVHGFGAAAKRHEFALYERSISSGSETELFAGEVSGARFVIPTNQSFIFEGMAVIQKQDDASVIDSWKFSGHIVRVSNTTTLEALTSEQVLQQDTGVLSIEADDTNEALVFKVTIPSAGSGSDQRTASVYVNGIIV